MKAAQPATEKVPGASLDRLDESRSKRRFPAPCLLSLAMLAILVIAAGLRLVDLGNRPMHCDEAVHAVKFGRLLERGEYTYDPHEYHGPSLIYLTLPVAWSASAETLTRITEFHLRVVPAFFGILLVGLPWLVRKELGYVETVSAAALTAVSPAMVFYSRYYIQEVLLVCFTFAAIVALWRYSAALGSFRRRQERSADSPEFPVHGGNSPRAVPWHARLRPAFWLIVLGACIGMMHASKETSIIALFAIVLAATFAIVDHERVSKTPFWGEAWSVAWMRLLPPLGIVVFTAAGVSVLFHSSFLTNPRGVADSFATYLHYIARASGEGSTGQQAYPWYHYFRIFFWWRHGDGPLWSEALIGGLAAVGLAASALGKGIPLSRIGGARFLSVYTLVVTVVYASFSYKTPWCGLGFLHGMILLAGVGAAVLVRIAPGRLLKAILLAGLTTATVHLGWQAHRASFVDFEDVNNPYVYAHTTGDVPQLVQQLRRFAVSEGQGPSMHVQVLCPDDDFWPLPWYMRDFSTAGWFTQAPQGPAAGVIIIQPEMESILTKYLYEDPPPGRRPLYVPAFEKESEWLLRPGVPLRVYVRRDLWEAYLGREH